ncbi:MAG: hypothetical protein GEV08_23815 [Acidimicrobiia bacterium]|nr:hypothetical protein [Acidimicrobiia bacterium]
MRRIPVATDRMTFRGVTVTHAETFDEATRTRSPKITAGGEQVWKVQCLVAVEGEDTGELMEVNIRGACPVVEPLAEAEFEGLAPSRGTWAPTPVCPSPLTACAKPAPARRTVAAPRRCPPGATRDEPR